MLWFRSGGVTLFARSISSKVSKAADKPICQGWVRVMGFKSIGVRIAFVRGQVSEREIEDHKGLELHESLLARWQSIV